MKLDWKRSFFNPKVNVKQLHIDDIITVVKSLEINSQHIEKNITIHFLPFYSTLKLKVNEEKLKIKDFSLKNSDPELRIPEIWFLQKSIILNENTIVFGKNFHEYINKLNIIKEIKYILHDDAYVEMNNNDGEQIELIYKTLLPNLKLSAYHIKWENIIFYNGYLLVDIFNKKHILTHDRSKYTFNDLRNLLKNSIFDKPTVVFSKDTGQIIKFTGFKIISDVFDFLEAEYHLSNDDLGLVDLNFKNHSGWSNERIIKAYRVREKSRYLDYLCSSFLSLSFKIIPVCEVRTNESNKSRIIETAFLFSIKKIFFVYIIWENKEFSRATFIFRCKPENYAEAVQKLYDYIVSEEITNKREKLHASKIAYFNNKTVKYIGCVSHPYGDFERWRRLLEDHLE